MKIEPCNNSAVSTDNFIGTLRANTDLCYFEGKV